MKKSRILDGVNQARFVPPYILSLLLAVVFVQGGEQLAYLALEPISAVLSLMLSFLGKTDSLKSSSILPAFSLVWLCFYD